MATYLFTHEVDDVEAWKASTGRDDTFGPMGSTARTFVDPSGSNRVGLIAEIPDLQAFQDFMATAPAVAAMKNDGVHPETMLMLHEA
jgi:hypothetical protein